MSEYIGNIAVPAIAASGVFPIKPDMGYGHAFQPQIAVHPFGSGHLKREQRFLMGPGVRHFVVRRAYLRHPDKIALRDFWETSQGGYGAFTYNAPSDDGTGTTAYVCRFANVPLSIDMLTDRICSVGVELIEIPQSTPSYALAATLDRFPSETLKTALLGQVQTMIPLVEITPKAPIRNVQVQTLAPVTIRGDARPWNLAGGQNSDFAYDAGNPAATTAPVVFATGLEAGDEVVVPPITGTVAYIETGFFGDAYYWYCGAAGTKDLDTSLGFFNDIYTNATGGYYYACHWCTEQDIDVLAFAGVIGAFTDDDGNVVSVVPVGLGGSFQTPAGATRFQLGTNRRTDNWGGGWYDGTSQFSIAGGSVFRGQPVEYPTIYLSDRRCEVGGQLYQARVTKWSGISQGMTGESDDATFSLANADKVMRDLANDVDLFRATLQFSAFHVQSGIRVNLWKGEVIDWTADQSPEFELQASDGLYELRLPYPCRKVSRTCWKQFADGLACPYLEVGSGGGPTCDKGFDTPDGCHAHNMDRYFGGAYCTVQGVRIKNNASGWHGLGRNAITATSIIADTIYDHVIPEVYTDTNMPVNGLIAAGRDESDFYDALAIICEGPVTFAAPYTDAEGQKKGHTVDGQFWHGYPARNMGLREEPGDDPAGADDYFSVSRVGTSPGPGEVTDGYSCYLKVYAAGTAFLEIRRSDSKGLQLSRPGEHTVTAIIAEGLKGWIWSAAGVRTWDVLTNPIWICVNAVLKARGLRFADAATAETQFDVDAAIAAAATCDLTVTKLVGAGSETQFQFRGVLADAKPLKDWIGEILMNCAGYFTWANGKVKFGIRLDATPVETFDETNIIFGSLRLGPTRPTFNHLSANFADEEFDYQANSVSISEEDHQRLVGGATTPLVLKSDMNLAGTPSRSQAARLITMRLREELGGKDYDEWKRARNITFRTTVLALNTEPGQVDELDHEEMPGGSGTFRTIAWRLNSDWSIEVQGRTVTDSMYDVAAEGGLVAADTAAPETTLTTVANGDYATPPAPTFTATVPGDGTVKAGPPSFSSTDNTGTVTGVEWTVWYWTDSTSTRLSGGITAGATSLTLASATGFSVGDYVSIDTEVLHITGLAGAVATVTRAQMGSAAAAHDNSAAVRKLSSAVSTTAYDPSNPTILSVPDGHVAAVQAHAVNTFGSGTDSYYCLLSMGADPTQPGPISGDTIIDCGSY